MGNTLRAKVYWWLERPDRSALGPRLLETALILLILVNVVLVVVETIHSIYLRWAFYFHAFELFSLGVFVLEYLARLWVAPEDPETPSRWAWARSPLAVIDLLAILPAALVLFVPLDLRILRAFRLVRLLKLTRYSPALGMLLSVFREEAGAFFAGFFILLMMLAFAASGAWLFEHRAQPDAFGSIPQAMWWAVATLTTVGYGDVVPITVFGKLFGAVVTVVGIGMAALPAGIIASGLNEQLHRRRLELELQFRDALEDGRICEVEEAEIEALRLEIGLSPRLANSIRADMLNEMRQMPHRCPHCGKHIV